MGEFLLSFLGFDAGNRHLVYKRKVHRAKWAVGDSVKLAYPNPKRESGARYYRIYNKFYAPEILHELVRSQDPNVIDKNGFNAKHREHVDNLIVVELGKGRSPEEVGLEYGWHPEAIKLALVRQKARKYAERDAIDALVEEYDEPVLIPEHLSDEEKAKRLAVLAQWA